MHLEAGDELYVNASEATIKAGLTDPRVLLRLVRAGVRCFCVPRLHAKVYVADGVVFIGSNNASNHSATVLTELAARVDDPLFLSSVIAWIGSLPAVRLDEDAVKPLLELYRPQRHRERQPRKRLSGGSDRANALWITNMQGDYDEALSEDYARWEEESEERLQKANRFTLFQLFFEGQGRSRLYDEVRAGDEVVAVDRGSRAVYGPMRVLNRIHREWHQGTLVRVLALEQDLDQQPVRFSQFRKDIRAARIAVLPESGRTERRFSTSSASALRLYFAERASGVRF